MLTDFADVHDKLFHLFIVSRDMTQLRTCTRCWRRTAAFTIEHTLPKAGH